MTTSIMSRGSRLRKQRCAREALSPFGRRAQIRISPRAYAESASLSKKSKYGLTGRAVVRGMCCGLRESLNTLPAPVPVLGPEQFDAKSNTARHQSDFCHPWLVTRFADIDLRSGRLDRCIPA